MFVNVTFEYFTSVKDDKQRKESRSGSGSVKIRTDPDCEGER
jgi:hypothetical protein